MANQDLGSVPSFDGIGRSYAKITRNHGQKAGGGGGGSRMGTGHHDDGVSVPVALIMHLRPEASECGSGIGSSGAAGVSLAPSAKLSLQRAFLPPALFPPVHLPSSDELALVHTRASELKSTETKAASASAAKTTEKVDLFGGGEVQEAAKPSRISVRSKMSKGVQRIFGQQQQQQQQQQQFVGGARLMKSDSEIGSAAAVFTGPQIDAGKEAEDRSRAFKLSGALHDIRLRGLGFRFNVCLRVCNMCV
jgi:hypothetical protein